MTPFEKDAAELLKVIESYNPRKAAAASDGSGSIGNSSDNDDSDDSSNVGSSVVDNKKEVDAQARVNAMISLKRVSNSDDAHIDRFFKTGVLDIKMVQKSCVHLGMRDPSSAAVMAAWKQKEAKTAVKPSSDFITRNRLFLNRATIPRKESVDDQVDRVRKHKQDIEAVEAYQRQLQSGGERLSDLSKLAMEYRTNSASRSGIGKHAEVWTSVTGTVACAFSFMRPAIAQLQRRRRAHAGLRFFRTCFILYVAAHWNQLVPRKKQARKGWYLALRCMQWLRVVWRRRIRERAADVVRLSLVSVTSAHRMRAQLHYFYLCALNIQSQWRKASRHLEEVLAKWAKSFFQAETAYLKELVLLQKEGRELVTKPVAKIIGMAQKLPGRANRVLSAIADATVKKKRQMLNEKVIAQQVLQKRVDALKLPREGVIELLVIDYQRRKKLKIQAMKTIIQGFKRYRENLKQMVDFMKFFNANGEGFLDGKSASLVSASYLSLIAEVTASGALDSLWVIHDMHLFVQNAHRSYGTVLANST